MNVINQAFQLRSYFRVHAFVSAFAATSCCLCQTIIVPANEQPARSLVGRGIVCYIIRSESSLLGSIRRFKSGPVKYIRVARYSAKPPVTRVVIAYRHPVPDRAVKTATGWRIEIGEPVVAKPKPVTVPEPAADRFDNLYAMLQGNPGLPTGSPIKEVKIQKVKTPEKAPDKPQEKPKPVETPAAPIVVNPDHISNVFQDSDLKQSLGDLSAAAGIAIIPDDSVTGTVTATLKDVPIEQALNIVLAPGGYTWVKGDGYYLVGKAEPTSPNFLRFAKTKIYKTSYLSPERITSLLPTAMSAYVKSAAGERSLTITASPETINRIMCDVKMLDQPAPKIILEALVTEVTDEVLDQYNLSFIWKKFGMSSSEDSSSFTYTQASANDLVTIKNLVGKGLAEVRANPRVITLEGKEASVEVAQENYFQVVTGPSSYPYTTVQQIKTGISLKMTPMISEDGQITVALNPEVSDAIGSGNNGLPINTVRRANTTVRVKDGETIVIGGMSYTNIRKKSNKVPLLGDIPLLGQVFTFHNNDTRKTEVVIMITPHIVK